MVEYKHAELFKALSVETRIRIIELLKEKGPLGVKDLAGILKITPSAVSQHLKVLRYAGLVHSERKGYWLPYEIDEEALEHCGEVLSHVCTCRCEGECKEENMSDEEKLEHLKKKEHLLAHKLEMVREKIRELESQE
ncbi:metalloregulator ArsR/SmtB family transcription factor [candidate division WOR-3 bacterium]|uniref:Metalloregulator ArsR/SmtB family transcription factor n=1 Tax=candidate division WOR-3 bacterium TaxID=2052148 RepID=A0A9D5KBA0_UNCW3|nr:metalloregulator ArsR/SmtB family transcription factor [candidate division WOR-3 bacterium]MBD3365552.1 metalloregulator ArsR/SmtB family transcription factor [candidate division WOR-3 bacterium]